MRDQSAHRRQRNRCVRSSVLRRAGRLTLPAFALVFAAVVVVDATSMSAFSARERSTPAGVSGTSSAAIAWQQFIAVAKDLGPTKQSRVAVVAELRSDARPAMLLSWARRYEIGVVWRPGQHWVAMQGAPASFDAAFSVRVHDYVAKGGARFYATPSPAAVPAAIRGEIASIGRISSYLRLSMAYVPNGGLTPTTLLRAYDASPLVAKGFRGAGRTVVFFEIDGFSGSDLARFASQYHLPPFAVTIVGGQAGPSLGESNMDIETTHAIASAAKLVYYNVGNVDTIAGWATAFTDVAVRYPGAIWSLSLDACEIGLSPTDVQVSNQAVATAESDGTSVYAAAGDSGGAECLNYGVPSVTAGKGVAFPAMLANVTGVGGTSMSVTTKGYYVGETTWTSAVLSQGSGGGVSTLVARPSWQIGRGVGGPQGGSQYREVPDVAAVADPTTGIAFITSGGTYMGGGTSLGPPIWAGFTALIDGYLASFHHPPLGFGNPVFYRLAANPTLKPPPFHDIKVGGNDFYAATPGYDPVTGLGTPDVAVLAADLLKNIAS